MAATVSGTIAVGMAPDAIAVNSTGNKIYVADFGTQPTLGSQACAGTGADVMVIDGATESTTAVGFPFAMNPVAMGLNPASHTVYVVAREFGPGLSGKGCSQLLDGVEAIDTSTLSTTGIIYQVSAIGGPYRALMSIK